MKRIALAAIAALTVGVGAAAFAQKPQTPEEQAKRAVEYRQSLFHVIGAAGGPVGGMLRGRVPYDAKAVTLAATRLEVVAGMIPELTATDTSKLVTNTEAKPEIWANKADFDAKAAALVKAAGALKTISAAGDDAATKKAMGEMMGACKSCHDKYKKDDH